MKRLFRFFILLNAIISIIAVCSDRPVITTSSITNSLLITPDSEGISNFPTSTTKLTITMSVIPDQACTAGSTFNLFAMGLTPPGSSTQEYLTASVDCGSLRFVWGGDWLSQSLIVTMFASGLGPVAFYMTFDLDAKTLGYGIQTETRAYPPSRASLAIVDGMKFDKNTKFYLCSSQLGVSPNACKISEFLLEYRLYDDARGNAETGHFAGKDPSFAAFYPLTDGPATLLKSYTYSKTQTSSGYFGDKSTNPTPGTSPSWDSSNAFVTLTKGQFLTFPIPSFEPGPATTSSSFAFAAWIRVRDTQASSTSTTILSTHLADGTWAGFKLMMTGTARTLSFSLKGAYVVGDSTPTVALDTWQLVGFTASVRTDTKYTEGQFFSGESSRKFYQLGGSVAFDFSSLALLRVGGAQTESFGGDISVVRIMTPGGGLVRYTDLCSPLSSVELGVADFALSCSGSNKLSSVDGKCYSSCPTGTRSTTAETGPLCLACSVHCSACDSTQCTMCDSSYYLYQGTCLDACPDKTYSAGSTCKDCAINCNACDSTKCLDCNENYYLYQGSCLDSCPEKTYSTDSTCQDCPISCKKCDSSQCFACEDNYLFYQGKCLTTCPEGTYSTGSTCESCQNNCKECDSSQCFSCNTNYLYYQGNCLNSCPEKTYSTGSKCQNCGNHCEACNSMQCLTCELNYFFNKGDCVDSCPAKTYVHESSCIACSDHCAECTVDECKACDNGYQLDLDKKCVLSSSSSQSSSPTQIKSGISGGVIAGIISGGIVMTVIAGWAVYVLKFKKTRIFPQRSKADFKFINSSPTSPTTAVPPIETCETGRPLGTTDRIMTVHLI